MLVPDSHSLSAAKGATYFTEEKKKNMILNVSHGVNVCSWIVTLYVCVCRNCLRMLTTLKWRESCTSKMARGLVGRSIFSASEHLVFTCPSQERAWYESIVIFEMCTIKIYGFGFSRVPSGIMFVMYDFEE